MSKYWWDTEEYRKRFVPYYQCRARQLLDWYIMYPQRRANIIQAWHTLGEDIEREYRFRVENGYDTEEIEEDIAYYHECSKILQEWIENGVEGSVSDTQ
jgi:hypothetical protein